MTVAGLQAAVKANNKTVGKGGFATGNALMQDLTDPAVAVLGNKVPDSGTVGRGMINGSLLGIVHPTALLGGALGSLLYTEAGQKTLAAFATPDIAAGVGEVIPQLAIPLGPTGGVLRSIGQSALAGGVSGALTPVTDPNADYEATKRAQAVGGAAGGGALGPVANLASRAVGGVLSGSTRPEVQALIDQGVTPHKR
jgi:hypothetical protein